MERRSNILRKLETRAGYRVLQWDFDQSELGRGRTREPWPRESFFWHLLIQLRSVSRLLYTGYPNLDIPSAEVTRLEELLRERGIEYQEMLPKGIRYLWFRLGLAGHTGLRIGGVPLADEELLERLLVLGFPIVPLSAEMYVVDAPVTPWSILFEKAHALLADPKDDMPDVFVVDEPSTRYLELLNQCVCAIYVVDLPYPCELHTVKLSDDQMLDMFEEAARRSGYPIS